MTAPTLTSINPLSDASKNMPYVISWADLSSVADESDLDGDEISFIVEGVSSGSLTKDGATVIEGVTTLSTMESLVWTPPSDNTGSIEAFTVRATDGVESSTDAIPVTVDVNPVDGTELQVDLTQTVIDALAGLEELAGTSGSGGSLSELLDAIVLIEALTSANYYYYSSYSSTDTTITLRYPDGATATYTGTLDDPYAYSGYATVSRYELDVPNALSITVAGDFRYYYNSYGDPYFYVTNGTVDQYTISVLDRAVLPELGRYELEMGGAVSFTSSGNLSGSISRFTMTAEKLVESSSINGSFSVSGNMVSIAEGRSSSTVSGTLTAVNDEYYDGSYERFSGGISGIQLGNGEILDDSYLADGGNFPGSDIVDIDLPSRVDNNYLIATGAGNDTVTLKGGGGNLHVNTGTGQDTITTLGGDHTITPGAGNDRVIGGSGTDTVVFGGAYQDYTIEWNSATETLALFSSIDGYDVLSGVEALQFSDQNKDASLLMNASPTLATVNTLTGATEDQDFTISWDDLAAAADEDDYEDDPISFRVESVNDGTLKKNGTSVTAGDTLLSEGESLVWSPSHHTNGEVDAFSIRAADDYHASSSAIEVTVSVTGVNDIPTGGVYIAGTEKSGQTLTASNDLADADGIGTISYQWLRDGFVVGSATGTTYQLSDSDVDSIITVIASYTDGYGTAESVTSAATSAIEDSVLKLVQVRNSQTLTAAEASIEINGSDYSSGSDDVVLRFDLWFDAKGLDSLNVSAKEIRGAELTIGWDDTQLDNVSAFASEGNATWLMDIAFEASIFDVSTSNNVDGNIALGKATAVVDTDPSNDAGRSVVPLEQKIGTVYINPKDGVTDIQLTIQGMTISTDDTDVTPLDYSVELDASPVDALIRVDDSYHLNNTTIKYYLDDSDTGISTLVEEGGIKIGESVTFDAVKLAEDAYSFDINITDAIGILRHIVNLDSLVTGSEGYHAADVNNDDNINITDAIDVLRHIVNLDAIDDFDLIDEQGNRVTLLDPDTTGDAPTWTIVANGDINLSGGFAEGYLIQSDLL